MVEYRVTMRRSPHISDEEARQRLDRAYDLLFSLKPVERIDDGEPDQDLPVPSAQEPLPRSSGDAARPDQPHPTST